LVINRVAPDQDLAGYPAARYPANFFAEYPVSGWISGPGRISGQKKNTKNNFYLNLEFYIVNLFVAQLFYFSLVEIVSPAGYPTDGTGSRKRPDIRLVGYPAGRISGATLVINSYNKYSISRIHNFTIC